jgi:hypothetical protein
MNLTRGFLRLWAVVSLIWIIGFGFNVFLDWRLMAPTLLAAAQAL